MLTASKIQALRPKPRRYRARDGRCLELEVAPSGLKSWRVRYRFDGKQRIINLGRWPAVSLADARAGRDRVLANLASGIPPTSQLARYRRNSKAVTFQEFSARYVAEVVAKARKSTVAIERWLKRDLCPGLGAKTLDSITADDVRELVFARRDAGAPQAAVALRDLIKRVFDYAMVCNVVKANPAHAVPRKFIARARPRERSLSETELGKFLRQLAVAPISERYRLALRLILLTLVRKSELRLAAWEKVNTAKSEWEIPPELTKNHKAHILYLSRQALECFAALRRLDSAATVVLPIQGSLTEPISASTLNRALARARGKLAHFTVHDLRRTASTHLAERGYESDVVEKSLNHTIKGVRGVYNRAQYAEQRRKMLQEWADVLDGLAG